MPVNPWVPLPALIGVRVGEASHPGPGDPGAANVVLAVINPTAILNKADTLPQLCSHVVVASETAATNAVQRLMSSPLRALGFKAVWGPPCPERLHHDTGRASLRGSAVGTALFSRLPCRPSIDAFEPCVAATCRLSEAFVRFHSVEVKILSLYGWPKCLPEAAAKNNWLLTQALNRILTSKTPAIVAGDFNDDPCNCPVWQTFRELGYHELGQFASSALGLRLPPTCKGSTRYDTCLLPASLLQFVTHADVLTSCHLYDAHAPMRVHFCMPGQAPIPQMWRLPRSFQLLGVDPALLQDTYASVSAAVRPALTSPTSDVGPQLRAWSAAVEQAVEDALAQAHAVDPNQQPHAKLPASCRGRCAERKPVGRVLPSLPRNGRLGDPQPVAETTALPARQRLRQCRRLVSLYRNLGAWHRKSSPGPGTPWPVSLEQEWHAIRAAKGYSMPFLEWLLQWPCFMEVPVARPTKDFLWAAYQFALYDYQALARQERMVKRDTFRYKLRLDAKVGGCAEVFSLVKPAPACPLQAVQCCHQQMAVQVYQRTFHCREYQVACPDKFPELAEVSFAGCVAVATRSGANLLTLQFSESDELVLPRQATVERQALDCRPEAIDGALVEFWYPQWNRDTRAEEDDIEQWPGFQQILHEQESPCAPFSVDMADLSAWRFAIRKLSPRKATGICGWHNSDLRLLPDKAVEDLVAVLGVPTFPGFPSYLMQARVAVLGKVDVPTLPVHCRPIAIMSNVYRLWARVLCLQVLQVWSSTLPPAIQGCLKGRCATDLCLWLQTEAECALDSKRA